MNTIVTGDDVAIPVFLTKDDKPFSISNAATVKVALVSADHTQLLMQAITSSRTANGADWSIAKIMAEIPGVLTAAITNFKPAMLEIEVNDNGKTTWFCDVRIVKGQIA